MVSEGEGEMLEDSADLWRYIHLEAASGTHISALRRWEHTDDEFSRRLGRNYYGCPEGWVDDLWREPSRLGWLAFAGEIPAGFVDLTVEPVEALAFVSLYAAPGFRGRGVGGILLERAARAASEYGICGLLADVEADNEACARCLRRSGFFEIASESGGLRTLARHIPRSLANADANVGARSEQ